jgi:hypothetical protein
MKSHRHAANSLWKTTAARRALIALAIVITAAFALRFRTKAADAAPTFTQTNLVSDTAGMAKTTDPNLVNPWGMALGINSGIWVSDEGTGKATTYDGTGKVISTGSGFNVTIPGASAGTNAKPTGIATNDTQGFVISSGGKSAPSTELFATLDGTTRGICLSELRAHFSTKVTCSNSSSTRSANTSLFPTGSWRTASTTTITNLA